MLDHESVTATEPIVPEAELLSRIPKERTRNHSETMPHSTRCRTTICTETDGCIVCNAAREGQVAKPHSLECWSQIKMRSFLKNPMKSTGEMRSLCDDVMQREYRWRPDLDVLMCHHQVKWLADQHRRSRQEQRQYWRNKPPSAQIHP